MKRGLVLLIFLLSISIVSALDIGESKYSSNVLKIKFDEKPDTIIYNNSNNIGCSADGRFFIKFDSNSDLYTVNDVKISYKRFAVPGPEDELKGTFYRRNMQTGKFENITGKLFNTFTYYFWSDSVFDEGDFKITAINLDGELRNKEYYIHCPKFKYTCADMKPVVRCYNTNDENLVIEMSGLNIDNNEDFSIFDLSVYTKGTNERMNVLENTLSKNAVMYKLSDDFYTIISPLIYGNPKAGTNLIKYVNLQPKICFFDMYPDVYVSQKCEGMKDVSSENLETNQITGAVVAETSSGSNYWIYGLVLLTLIVIIVFVIRRKKH